MKRSLSVLFAIIGWFAVIAQFVLMMQNLTTSVGEGIIRFFSFFTILTNTLLAAYFTSKIFKPGFSDTFPHKPGHLTAITVYIFIVGLVYQLILRFTWDPQGMQRLVDEILHSVTPVLAVIYWFLYEKKEKLKYQMVLPWMIYPLVYLLYILARGGFAHFYPYPFVNVDELGYSVVLKNSFLLTLVFAFVSLIFIWIGKRISNK
jgi:hypothetical protein